MCEMTLEHCIDGRPAFIARFSDEYIYVAVMLIYSARPHDILELSGPETEVQLGVAYVNYMFYLCVVLHSAATSRHACTHSEEVQH